jgi:hypothetical protein
MSKPPHRDLPVPPWFDGPVYSGHCRWCGWPVRDKKGALIRRRTWHAACADEYMMLKDPTLLRRKVWERDSGLCAKCGKRCSNAEEGAMGWQVDHITPLIDATPHPYFWNLDNLQTLCLECHAWKTKAENAARERGRPSGSQSRGSRSTSSKRSALPHSRGHEKRNTDRG